MQLNNLFSNQVNGIETDFRAEVIAVELIENGASAEDVLIVPLGAQKRPHSKDIEAIEEDTSAYNKDYILIRTHREGLYDKLPEGLFHSPIAYISEKTEQQVIESIRLHRLEEKAARAFFLPFDVSLAHARVLITQYENQLDKKFHFNQLVNIFSSYWDIFQHLNVFQANIFLQFLPNIHKMRDDWPAIEMLFELIFLTPAKLKLREQRPGNGDPKENALFSALGTGELGVDITIGNYMEGGAFTEMVVTFGPLTAQQLNQFTGKAQQEKIALMLCNYLVPADVDVVIEYDLVNTDRTFCLNEPGNTNNCEMGVSTYL